MEEAISKAMRERTREAIASIPILLLSLGIITGILKILDMILVPYVLGY